VPRGREDEERLTADIIELARHDMGSASIINADGESVENNLRRTADIGWVYTDQTPMVRDLVARVSEVAGLKGYLTLDLSPGFGYTGIAVAMLAQLHPIGVIASALFLSAVYVGADAMSRAAEIPTYIADVLVGISVLAILVAVMLTRYRIRWR